MALQVICLFSWVSLFDRTRYLDGHHLHEACSFNSRDKPHARRRRQGIHHRVSVGTNKSGEDWELAGPLRSAKGTGTEYLSPPQAQQRCSRRPLMFVLPTSAEDRADGVLSHSATEALMEATNTSATYEGFMGLGTREPRKASVPCLLCQYGMSAWGCSSPYPRSLLNAQYVV
ncbi:hypothetical protein C8Q72DRAFT_803684 [Fomitopsis betulina]|nr:hypothetical protein C8Q72DRAFT_803684 [Fomitopsis betulina]